MQWATQHGIQPGRATFLAYALEKLTFVGISGHHLGTWYAVFIIHKWFEAKSKLVYKWRWHCLHKKIISFSLANNFSTDFTQMCSSDFEMSCKLTSKQNWTKTSPPADNSRPDWLWIADWCEFLCGNHVPRLTVDNNVWHEIITHEWSELHQGIRCKKIQIMQLNKQQRSRILHL